MKLVIIIAIKPKYVAIILNGLKTLEIRKTFPHIDFSKYESVEVYIYCTKDNNALLHKNIADIWWVEDRKFRAKSKKLGIEPQPSYNGKVVGYFTLNEVEEHKHRPVPFPYNELCKNACLTQEEIEDYAFAEGKGYQTLYAWHIDNLVIFDKPLELSNFYKVGTQKKIDDLWNARKHTNPFEHIADSCIMAEESHILQESEIKRPPQSYMFAEYKEVLL